MRIIGLPIAAVLLLASSFGLGAPYRPNAHGGVVSTERCLATGAPRDSFAIIALTEAGSRLVALGANSGVLLHSYFLGPVRHPPVTETYPSGYPAGSITLDERTCEVIAAAVDSASGVTRVLALSLRDWQLRTVATIAGPYGFPWVDVGRLSGRLYLMGSVGIRVTVIDRTSGAIIDTLHATWSSRPDFYVWRARVSPDERRVYVAYHGRLDWIDLATGQPCPNTAAAPRDRYCQVLEVHGDFDFLGNDIVAASGGPDIQIFDSTVTLRRSVAMATHQANGSNALGHFMWPSLDTHRGIVYGTLFCTQGFGIISKSIADTAIPARVLADTACGAHIAPTADGNMLIVLDFEYETLTVVDTRSGKTTLTIGRDRAGRHPLDVLGVSVEHP